jgi:outer membrane receptor protein involved in Fe transport
MKHYQHLAAALWGGIGTLALASVVNAQNAAKAGDDQELSEVIVTGSRVITNGNDSPNPVTVVTMEELQASHPTTVFEALEELPQFSSGRGGSLGGSTGQGSSNNSIASLNLRALGPLRGLVLFDGHRVPPQNVDGTVDINQIPQQLLQRVDLQTGGASAVYGSDAITGVVNFITDRKFNGIKFNVQAGISAAHDDRSNELAVAMGHDLFGGRGHIEGSVQSHYDAGLYRDQRSFVQAPGGNFWTIQGNGATATPYFLTQNAFDSSQTYGGKIVGPATVTVGGVARANPLLNQNFTANGVLSPFVNGVTAGLTGTSQIGGQGGLAQEHITLKTPIDDIQLFSRFDFDVTDKLHFFAVGSYNIEHQFSTLANVRSGVSATSKLGAGYVMSTSNAFLPSSYASQLQTAGFTTFNVGKVWDTSYYLPNTYDYHIHNAYLNTGFEGKFGDGWRWETSLTRSQAVQANTANTTISTGRLFAALDAVVNPANGQVVCQVSLTANANLYPGCVPLNIFGPTATTADAMKYVVQPTRYISTTDLSSISGSIAGAPFSTWAGPVNMALSGEWRKLKYLFLSYGEPQNVIPLDCTGLRFNCVAPTATDIGTSQTYGNGSAGTPLQQPVTQTVKEAALEADIPLLKDIRFAKDVSLLLAFRNAGYSSFGTPAASVPQSTVTSNANTWKVGLDWHVNDALTLRGTRSRDFRAPNLGDLFLPGRVQGFTLAQDLLTGATNVLAQQQIGGNPGLKPEVGYTTTIGFVLKPTDAYSLSVDAYDIAISNGITNIDGSSTVNQNACYASGGVSSYCSLQVRPLNSYTNTSAANTATLWFTSVPINVAYIHTQGVDVENNLKLHVMDRSVQLRALFTYQPHIWTQQPLSATLDSAGVSSPRMRATVSARFSPIEALTVDWSTRWRSGLQNIDPRTLQANGQPVVVVPGSLYVPSVTFSNVTLTYHISKFTLGKMDAYLNVLNVFNQIPPVYVPAGGGSLFGQVAGNGGVSYYPADDAIGRYYNVGVRVRL